VKEHGDSFTALKANKLLYPLKRVQKYRAQSTALIVTFY